MLITSFQAGKNCLLSRVLIHWFYSLYIITYDLDQAPWLLLWAPLASPLLMQILSTLPPLADDGCPWLLPQILTTPHLLLEIMPPHYGSLVPPSPTDPWSHPIPLTSYPDSYVP